MNARPYYITTPIYYVNDVPHIGHAYTTLACDVLARFKRLDGHEVMFLTGTDEHGQKVEKSAAKAGEDPQSFCDRVSGRFRELVSAMNLSADQFIRTTEDRHAKACQELWKRIEAGGHIYLDTYKGWYAVRDEAFYAESELTEGKEGEKLAPTGAPVEWVEEPSYFFRLSDFAKPLLKWYADNPGCVMPKTRMNEVRSFVEGGLKDLSISRTTFSWGVPVPGAPDHIMYVWIDALTNYLTGLGWPDEDGETFKKFWPADVHMVGKDILRFHAVYWPAFLMAAGLEPPKRIFAHGWWTNEGQRISKSLGNVIDPFEISDKYGLDPVRYFLMREVPFGQDGDFSKDALVARLNGELANDLGNLAQRSLSMIKKNCAGRIPTKGDLTDKDKGQLAAVGNLLPALRAHVNAEAPHKYLEAVWKQVAALNQYISEEAPWTHKKDNPARMQTILYVVAEGLRQIAILLQPVMPDSMGKMLDQLGVPGGDARTFAALDNALEEGTEFPNPAPVFPRWEEK